MAAAGSVYPYVVDGTRIAGIDPGQARNWTIPTVKRIGRAVDDAMPAGSGAAISWWPGYFVESRTSIFRGMENPFTLFYSSNLAVVDVARYDFITHGQIAWSIERHATPIVVIGNWMLPAKKDFYRSELTKSGYVLIQNVEDAEIYRVRRR